MTVKDTTDRTGTQANATPDAGGGKLHDVGTQVRDAAAAARDAAAGTLAGARDRLNEVGASVREVAGSARASAGETLTAARDKATDVYGVAVDRTSSAYEDARERAAAAAAAAREKASSAYASARDTASHARVRAAEGLDESPIAAVIGGIAVGILIGALLPRSQRETEVLAPLGDKLAGLASGALAAAKEAGQDKLDELGINKDAAREQVGRLLDTAQQAATSAGTAAAGALRQPPA